MWDEADVAIRRHVGWCECLGGGTVWGHRHWVRGLGFQEKKFLELSPEGWTELELVRLVGGKGLSRGEEVRRL